MKSAYFFLPYFLSVAFVVIFSPVFCRAGKKCILSTAQGIILFRIVKSIIVECGWGFAAAAGIVRGFFLEGLVMCCGLVLFRELGGNSRKDGDNIKILPLAGIIMLWSGKSMMCSFRLIPFTLEFIIGKAAMTAIGSTAVCAVCDEKEAWNARSFTFFMAVCSGGSFATEWLLRRSGCGEASSVGPLLIMLGCCELICVFVEGMKRLSEISPFCFAFGLLLSFGFDCLTG